MKKFLLSVMSVVAILMLAGCQQGPSGTQNSENPELPEAAEEELSFIGSWTRVSLVVNGTPMDQTPAVLTLNNDHSFTSIGSCAASGRYDISNETDYITMSISSTNCPSGGGVTVMYQYSVTEDGNTMVNTTSAEGTVIVETYTKNS